MCEFLANFRCYKLEVLWYQQQRRPYFAYAYKPRLESTGSHKESVLVS